MESNKYLRLNAQKCERYLSTFGRKVLQTLMRQWSKTEGERKVIQYRQCHEYHQSKKVINFCDNSSSNVSITNEPPPIQTYEEKIFQLNITNEIIPEIPTLEELHKTIDIQDDVDDDVFAHPTIVQEVINKESEDVNHDQTFEKNNTMIDNVNKIEDVDWDNMFDSELFDGITRDNPNEVTNAVFDIVCKKQTNTKTSEKRKNKNLAIPKVAKKAKKDDSDNLDGSTNKPNIRVTNDVPKISCRKQKYTKTVKTWLNNMKTCDQIEEDIDNILEYNENLDNNKEAVTEKTANNESGNKPTEKLKITVDKPVKNNKKVVQAQLANKGGIMKFSKPSIPTTSNTDAHDKKAKEIDTKATKKEKAIKKFVPPIKSQIPVKDHTYEIITSDDNNAWEWEKKLNDTTNNEIMAILTYSNDFCQLNSNFTDATCAANGIIISINDKFYCFKDLDLENKETLGRLLTTKKIISYEGQAVLIYLASLRMETSTIEMYDTKIGASLLDPDNPPENFMDLQKLISFTPSFTIATECPLQKAAWYMSMLKECWTKLQGMLVDNQVWQVFVEIEMKLLPIIAEMERRGVSIDESKLKSMEEILLSRMKLVEQECYKAAGKVFQINSTLQVRGILYDELQLDTKSNVKIRETLTGGVKSTSEIMLRSLMSVHPLPKLILEYRHLHKAHATFLTGIAQHVKDGVVRPTWVQTAAATGRIASNNPNLQAIPKVPFSLVMFPDPDANDTDDQKLNFRSVYVSREGYTLVAADFKHVECRVFAHAATDTGLLLALTQSDDLFRVLSAQWLNKPESSVTATERERTKRLVYASLYGAGTRKLMEILDVSYEHALQVAASFNRTFPSLKSFGRHVVSQCTQSGGRLTTLCGRVRHFANIASQDFGLRSHAERQAVNFIIQGSAADLCKTAMVLTSAQLRSTEPAVDARLLLQIHDELVWEVNQDHVHAAADTIKRVMEGCGQHCGMSLTLPVTVTVGHNWGEMEPL